MKFVRNLAATMAVLALFAFSLPSFAQDQSQDRDRTTPAQASITGCLTKGDVADQWVIIDNQSGEKVVVTGADFDKHANHTVKVTGTPSQDGTFTVAKIEHVANSCQPK